MNLASSQSLNDLFSSIFSATTPVPTVIIIFLAVLVVLAVKK